LGARERGGGEKASKGEGPEQVCEFPHAILPATAPFGPP
jgi:hypothetical protein